MGWRGAYAWWNHYWWRGGGDLGVNMPTRYSKSADRVRQVDTYSSTKKNTPHILKFTEFSDWKNGLGGPTPVTRFLASKYYLQALQSSTRLTWRKYQFSFFRISSFNFTEFWGQKRSKFYIWTLPDIIAFHFWKFFIFLTPIPRTPHIWNCVYW